MKLEIKVKESTEGCMPEIIEKGEWVDLKAAFTTEFKAPQSGVRKTRVNSEGITESYRNVSFDTKLLQLGVAIELPKGFEAVIVSRSSLPKLHVFQTNSIGIIDNSYNGNDDVWRFWATALGDTTINKGDRICQFRIQLSQKATMWQKIKWMLSSGIKLVKVDNLSDNNRGGIGSTGL